MSAHEVQPMTVRCTILLCAVLLTHAGAQPASSPAEAVDGKQTALRHQLEQTLEQTARELDGVLAFAILDLTSGETMLRLPDEVFATASTIKIAILAELYRQEQEARAGGKTGLARLTDLYVATESDWVGGSGFLSSFTPGVSRLTNRDLAVMMMAVSDNSATNVLIERVGMENVNALLRSLGLKHTALRRRMMDLEAGQRGQENVSTARELTELLRLLHGDSVLQGELKQDFFRVLALGKDSPIRRGIPDGVQVASKPGSLEGVRNDAGIVFVAGRPFAMAVMAAYLKRDRAGEEAIEKVAAAAYSYFERIGRASPHGRYVMAPEPPQ